MARRFTIATLLCSICGVAALLVVRDITRMVLEHYATPPNLSRIEVMRVQYRSPGSGIGTDEDGGDKSSAANAVQGPRTVSVAGSNSLASALPSSLAVNSARGVDEKKQLTMDLQVYSDELFLVSAHSDLRRQPPTVKIIIYGHKHFKEQLSCSFDGDSTAYGTYSAELSWINYPSEEMAHWRAGYLECIIPNSALNASRVVLRKSAGSAGVLMQLSRQPPQRQRQTFGLCVKSGYGTPSAARFIEWMELNALLGVEHVIVYDQDFRGPVLGAMRLYAQRDALTVVKDNFRRLLESEKPEFIQRFANFDATVATGDEPYFQMELLSIQDCFHRFRRRFEYVIVVDIDEVLVPTSASTLHELLHALKLSDPQATSFGFQTASYLQQYYGRNESSASDASATGQTYMLTHTRRNDISWDGSKAFHSTDDTDKINWHRRIQPWNKILLADNTKAWVHHYRGSCKGSACDDFTKFFDDKMTILGKFATQLAVRVADVLRTLTSV